MLAGKEVRTFIADFTDQFGKRHRPGFKREQQAKDHIRKVEGEILARSYRPDGHKIKVKEVTKEFIENSEKRVKRGEIEESIHNNYKGLAGRYIVGDMPLGNYRNIERMGKFFAQPIGEFTVGDLDVPKLKEFRGDVQDEGLARTTVKNTIILLALILDLAVEKKFIAANPARNLPRQRSIVDVEEDVVVPEKFAIKALLDATEGRNHLLILFAAATGLRTQEQRALAWRHVDLEAGTVKVERALDPKNRLKAPKSEAGKREVRIAPSLANLLREHRQNSHYPNPDDLIFPTRNGTPFAHTNMVKGIYNKAWKIALSGWKGEQRLERANWQRCAISPSRPGLNATYRSNKSRLGRAMPRQPLLWTGTAISSKVRTIAI
jgi:integrase